MKHVSRTINPIHFEDLEPHRFEDLVRQLSYGFRNWNKIEATGKSGSDDGIDIRAFEKTENEEDELDKETEDLLPSIEGREWRIQCKREKTISPGKIDKILSEMFPDKSIIPHGLILAAACDFSKKSRDKFRDACIKKGIQEFHIWSKSEIEDMLYMPKNDRILFGFFGLSLSTQKKSQSTALNRKIVIKKKLVKLLGELNSPINMDVLLRDPKYPEYPWTTEIPDFKKNPKWLYLQFLEHRPVDSLLFLCREHFAMVNPDTKQWDFMDGLNLARFNMPKVATLKDEKYDNWENRRKFHDKWMSLVPDKSHRAHYKVFGVLSYDNILAIDELGDVYNDGPHLLVNFDEKRGPFSRLACKLITENQDDENMYETNDDLKIKFFNEEINKDTGDN